MRPQIFARLRSASVLAGLLIGAACSTDNITAPTLQTFQPNLAVGAGLNNALERTVNVGGRLKPLTRVVSATAAIGTAGGTLSLPELGFELVVPPGAVNGVTSFSVTALPGNALSYGFEPHGARFNVPLIFRQNALYTSVGWGRRVGGAYFTHPTKVDQKGKKALVAEQMPAIWNGLWIEFSIKHFSGYLVSCA